MNLDKSRDEDQKKAIAHVKQDLKKHKKACLNCCPGWGKTRAIVDLVYKPAKENNPDIKLFTLVGSDYLRQQWRERDQGLSTIQTWQSLYNKAEKSVSCDILVVDEIHKLLLTEKYIRSITKVISWKYLISLSGTLDDRHKEIMKRFGIPISYVVTEEEAIAKGWLNRKSEYNLELEMSFGDSKRYMKLEEQYREACLFIDANVDNPETSKSWANYRVIADVQKYTINGYKGIDGGVYHDYNRDKNKIKHYQSGAKKGEPYENKRYYNAEHVARMRGVDPGFIVSRAAEASRIYGQKTKLIYNNAVKVQAVREIMNRFPDRKFITFSNQTAFTDTLEKSVGGRSYHGKQGKKLQKQIVDDFVNDKISCIHTVGKVKEGADIKGVDTAINCAYYSKWTEKFQKDARAGRAEKNKKETLVINLYTVLHRAFGNRPTFEKFFLNKAQKNKEVKWIKNIEEIEND